VDEGVERPRIARGPFTGRALVAMNSETDPIQQRVSTPAAQQHHALAK
jgi:hypothetical protein